MADIEKPHDASLDEVVLGALNRSEQLKEEAKEPVPGLSKLKKEDLKDLVIRFGEERAQIAAENEALREEVELLRAERDRARKNERQAVEDAERATYEATHDVALTGLLNRKGTLRALERHFTFLAKRQEQLRESEAGAPPPTADIIMLDIDYFKSFNDNYGHRVGDRVLQMVAEVLRNALRGENDLAIRWGGEEFMVILLDSGPGVAYLVAERIRSLIEHMSVRIGEQSLRVTASLGVAHWEDVDGLARRVGSTADRQEQRGLIEESLAQSAEHADKALYEAKGKDWEKEKEGQGEERAEQEHEASGTPKTEGRNRVRVYGLKDGEPVPT